jgi:Fe-S cluster assembly protein SufD
VRPIPTSSPRQLHLQQQLGSGAVALDLESFIQQYPHEAAAHLFNRSPKLWNHRQIYAYADAYADHALVIYIPPHVRLADPIALHSLFEQGDAIDRCQTYRIIAGHDAQATIIDRYRATQGTHIRSVIYHVGSRATLSVIQDHVTQDTAQLATAQLITCAEQSRFSMHCLIQPALQTDSWFDLLLEEPGAEAHLRGIYALGQAAKLNIIAEQQHTAAHTTSEIQLNGCLTGQASAHYQGRIHIAKAAEHAVAAQRNSTLLVSDTARALSVPTLEALAHNVHCVHASAVGSLDANAIAYLVSRGIAESQARRMLIDGFLQSSLGPCALLEPVCETMLHRVQERP